MAWNEEEEKPVAKPVDESAGAQKPGWERELLERLAQASLTEQRRARRWGIFFKLAFLVYLLVLLGVSRLGDLDQQDFMDGRHTALVDVRGVIADEGEASADLVVSGLRKAFESDKAAAVVLRINSPGGSPVQSGYIYDEIKRLRAKYPEKPLYAVISDVGASGAYYLAAAADKIYADQASLVGSIGVRMDGFGFVDAMEKLGVERRLLTAGKHKGILDPFSPVKEEETAHVQSLLDDIHAQFIARVKQGRGERLKASDEALFNGLIWTGEQALALGLVDGLGSTGWVAREVVGEERVVDYTAERDIWQRLAERVGATTGAALRGVLDGGSLR